MSSTINVRPTLIERYTYNPNIYKTHPQAQISLYSGADISMLDYIFVEMRKFVSHPSYAKVTVTENFQYDKVFKLPKPNCCPSSFRKAKTTISEFLVPIRTFNVCPNDCVIFRNDLKDATMCPKCSEQCFVSGRPKKVVKYLPLKPPIARMCQDENLIKIMQLHCARKGDGFLRDIWDTNQWKEEWFGRNGEFGGNDGVALDFCTDGINPMKTMQLVYSVWPLMISVLNLPISRRKSIGGIMVVGLIPGNG